MVTIKAVVGLLAYSSALLGYLPLFPYIGQIPRVMFAAAFLYGIAADRKGFELRKRLATIVSLAIFVFYAVQFTRHNLVVPAANLLVALLAVRLASEKSARHYLQIIALALFALASSSLFTLSAVFLAYLLLMIFIIGVALVMLTFYAEDRTMTFTRGGLQKVLLVALLLPIVSLPLIVCFFFILPRTQFPLWNFLNGAVVQTTGLSDKVRPGSATTSGEAKNVVLRAASPRLDRARLYWRGIVFNDFEDNAWVRRTPPPGEEDRSVAQESVIQTIYPEPGRTPYLVALSVPQKISGIRSSVSGDLVYTRNTAFVRRSKYETVSATSAILTTPRGIDRGFYLTIPQRMSQRFRVLGGEARSWGGDEEKLARLEEYFMTRKFVYATTDLPVSADPLDEFLFTRRRGNCEYFASSAALVLRLAGVPARLVGGYYGGDYNELGGYYVVTEDMAHVWVEAYVTGKGWVILDPSGWAVNASLLRGGSHPGLTHDIQLAVDSLAYYWNLTVINYDLDTQLELLSRANADMKRFSVPSPAPYVLLSAALSLTALAGLFYCARRRRVSREERLLARFLKKVERVFRLRITPAVGLYDIAAQIGSPEVDQFVTMYGRAVYGGRTLTRDEVRQLDRLLAVLHNREKQYSGTSRQDTEG